MGGRGGTWTRYSLSASSALVASSRSKTLGFISRALAIAILCFWPPESRIPRSPTWVLYWSGNFDMNSWALAIFWNWVRRVRSRPFLDELNTHKWKPEPYSCVFYVGNAGFSVQSVCNVLLDRTVEKHRLLAYYADLRFKKNRLVQIYRREEPRNKWAWLYGYHMIMAQTSML